MTPDVVGGTIIPLYWYEDARHEVGSDEVGELTSLADEHIEMARTFASIWMIGYLFSANLGLGMLLRCFVFAPQKEFLKSGSVGKDANTSSVTSTASATASTSSTTA